MSNYNMLKNKKIFGKYKLNKIIGKGSFGCVYHGININNKSEVAVKVEKKNSKDHLLELESNYLCLLKGFGIPEIKSYGHYGNFYILVEELLGNNLRQIKNITNLFTLKDISMIAIQIIDRIEYVHSKYIIHRDIKPENFLLGYKNNSTIYIIDFGISRKYKSSRTGKHIRFSKTGKLFGTIRYCSYNASRGIEQSRRDDLISIGYMLIFLRTGNLPWINFNLNCKNKMKIYLKITNLKKNTNTQKLCKNLPNEFAEYLEYCQKLSFEQDPDYEYLRNLFRKILANINEENDFKFSWSTNIKLISKRNSNYLDISKAKYTNLLQRKESSQKRLYKSIQKSLSKDKKSTDRRNMRKYDLSSDHKNIYYKNEKENNLLKKRGGENELKIHNNSNISKDLSSYISLHAFYNLDILEFKEDYNQIEQLNNIKKEENKISQKTITKNNSKKNYNLTINKYNKKENIKEKMNISLDLDKKYIKDNILSYPHSHSEIINLNKLNKRKKSTKEEKNRKIYYKNIYINIINRINNQFNSYSKIKNDKNISNKISRNKNKINKKKLNEKKNNFISENSTLNINEKINYKGENMNNNLEIKKNNLKNNYYKSNNNNNNAENNNDKNIRIIEKNNEVKKNKINNDNINFNIINYLENNKIENNNKKKKFIITNNIDNFNKYSNNQITDVNRNHNYLFYNTISHTDINMNNKNYTNRNKFSKDIFPNDNIIENDYNSYHYINKVPKISYQNENSRLIENKSKEDIKSYLYLNNTLNYEKNRNYIIIPNKILNLKNMGCRSPNRKKIKILEYKSIYNQQSSSIPKKSNNNINNINSKDKKEIKIKENNEFLVRKKMLSKVNTMKQIAKPSSLYINNDFSNEKTYIEKNNNRIINTNSFQYHKFSNDFNVYNLKHQYQNNGNLNKFTINQNIGEKIFRPFSPRINRNNVNLVSNLENRSFDYKKKKIFLNNKIRKKNFNYNLKKIENIDNLINLNSFYRRANDFNENKYFNIY